MEEALCRERGIKSKMGCDVVWNPSYTSNMVMHGLEAWMLDDIVLWQYCGDGVAAIDENKLPRSILNFGKVDISVYIEGKNNLRLTCCGKGLVLDRYSYIILKHEFL